MSPFLRHFRVFKNIFLSLSVLCKHIFYSVALLPFSVAKGPKFLPQNSKGALKKFVRPEKLAAEFSLNMPKKGRKGVELF
jgi:hypothetical protein